MLNILWVEDNYSEQKQRQWFKDRPVTVKNNFDAAEEAINSDLQSYDVIVLDINLENSERSENVKKYADRFGLSIHDFLEKSGMNLYFMLLEHGFPKERIVFLTANANATTSQINDLRQAFDCGDDNNFEKILASITRGFGDNDKRQAYRFIENSNGCDENDITELCNYLESYFKNLNEGQEKNTYEILRDTANSCRIEVPNAFNKGTNQLDIALTAYEKNKYLVLRRGIIEGCKHAESLINSDIFFNKYMLENELIQEEDIKNYFGILKHFLPMREPVNKKSLYKLFIRTLSHEWEAAKNIKKELYREKKIPFWPG